MTLEEKTALVIKELFQWDGQIASMLEDSDAEDGKVYSFDSNEALDTLELFVDKYSSGR